MTISKFDFDQMAARVDAAKNRGLKICPRCGHHGDMPFHTCTAPASEPVDREGDLHDQIEAELKLRRWYYVHSRMDKASTQSAGVPDFIIAAPPSIFTSDYPRTFWVECKKRGGKLNAEQTVTKHILLALGHQYHTVYSFEEFLNIVNL